MANAVQNTALIGADKCRKNRTDFSPLSPLVNPGKLSLFLRKLEARSESDSLFPLPSFSDRSLGGPGGDSHPQKICSLCSSERGNDRRGERERERERSNVRTSNKTQTPAYVRRDVRSPNCKNAPDKNGDGLLAGPFLVCSREPSQTPNMHIWAYENL